MGASRSKPPSRSGKSTAFTRLKEQLQTVDLLFEVRDARTPLSSRHPSADEIFGQKPRIIVLAKQDLTDSEILKKWLQYLSDGESREALALSFKLRKGQDLLISTALRVTKDKRLALEKRGLLPRPMRACVVGMPNTGKSTLINWLTGRHKAATGNMPGVTRGTQWVRVHPQLELLDSPGILPPVAFAHDTSMKLALCNLIPQDHYDFEDVAAFGLAMLYRTDKDALKIYGDALVENGPTLENLAIARSCVASGGVPDKRRAAALFLTDFRSGKLGKMILDEL